MSFEILEKQIRALPEEALEEISHYVSYISSIYLKSEKSDEDVTSRINNFLKANPNAFDEFKGENRAALESIRELTKNDTW